MQLPLAPDNNDNIVLKGSVWNRLANWVNQFKITVSGAAHLRNEESSYVINVPWQSPPQQTQILIQIGSGNQQDSPNYRWTYAWQQVQYSVNGNGDPTSWYFTVVPGGLSGTETNNPAINGVEVPNTDPNGLQGNGINTGNWSTTGMEIQPITPGNVYPAIIQKTSNGFVAIFSDANGFDGTCAPTPPT